MFLWFEAGCPTAFLEHAAFHGGFTAQVLLQDETDTLHMPFMLITTHIFVLEMHQILGFTSDSVWNAFDPAPSSHTDSSATQPRPLSQSQLLSMCQLPLTSLVIHSSNSWLLLIPMTCSFHRYFLCFLALWQYSPEKSLATYLSAFHRSTMLSRAWSQLPS